jgi:hypothetical protein
MLAYKDIGTLIEISIIAWTCFSREENSSTKNIKGMSSTRKIAANVKHMSAVLLCSLVIPALMSNLF